MGRRGEEGSSSSRRRRSRSRRGEEEEEEDGEEEEEEEERKQQQCVVTLGTDNTIFFSLPTPFPFQSFVTCSLEVGKVGLVNLPHGAMSPVMGITWALLVKRIGRLPVFIIGAYSQTNIDRCCGSTHFKTALEES